MSEPIVMEEIGKNKMSALLAMLRYVSDELGAVDAISQFCVDMAIHQLSDRARSLTLRVNASGNENTLQ